MKRIPCLLLSACVLAGGGALTGLTACTTADYSVGILQLIGHDALDDATLGFQDALKEAMDKAGKSVYFDVQNAQGEPSTCTTIANGFAAKGYDLVLGNATAALEACYASMQDIPILGTSVTVYSEALSLENFDDEDPNAVTGFNVSGTSDLAPLEDQAQMIVELFPDARKVGILYCSSESNSKYQAPIVKNYLEGLGKGYQCTEYKFSDSNDLSAVVRQAARVSDVIYVPTDNMVANNAEIVRAASIEAETPVIAGEKGICKGCGVASLSIDYYELGVITGEMAAEILLEGADVSKMPIRKIGKEQCRYLYNAELCEEFGITPPDGYEEVGAAG